MFAKNVSTTFLISTIFKQLPTIINDLNKLGISLKSLDSMNLGIVGVNTGNIQAYQTAIKGLSAEQAVFALKTKNANVAQIEEIMTTQTATLAKDAYTQADIQAALAKNGLSTSATILTTAQQKEIVQSGLITSEKLAEVTATLGLTTAEDGSLITKKALNVEMVKQQLTSMGVVGAAQQQVLVMLRLVTAEGGTVASTNVLTASFAKLWAVISSHPIGAIITAVGALAVGVTAAVSASNKTKEEARQTAIELTNAYTQEKESLDSQIDKYKELKETLDSGNLSTNEARSIKEQLLEIQQSLIESYGNEASNIDLVNGKYKEQLGLLSSLSKEKATEYVTENRDVFSDAKKALEKVRTYNLGRITSWSSYIPKTKEQQALLDFIGSYSELFEINASGSASHGGETFDVRNLQIKATVEDADDIMHQFAVDLENYGKENDIDVSGLLESISGQLKKTWTDELTEYKTIYDEFMKAEIVRNDTLRPLYQESIQAVEEYNNALSTGEGVEEAKANLESVQQSVQNATGELEGSQDVFDGIYEGINKDAEAAYNLDQSFKNDKSVQNYAEQLRGLSDVDLKAINFDNDNTEKGEEAFRGLMETLGLTEDQVQSLIDKLVELGYVQGEVQGSTFNNEVTFSDIFALENSDGELNALGKANKALDDFQKAYTGLKEAMDSYNKTGYFTVDQVQDIISYGGEYLKYLMDENGNLKLNEEVLNNVAVARINEMRVKSLSQLMDELDKITDETSANKYLAEQLLETASAYDNLAESRINAWLSTTYADSNITDATRDAVLESFRKQAKAINEMYDKINIRSLSGSVDKDFSSLLEKEINALEKSAEAGTITYKEYLKERERLVNDYYNRGLITAEQYYDELEKLAQAQKDYYDDVLAAVVTRYDREIDKVQKTIDSIEEQNDALQKQLDIYDSALNAIQDLIDSEKELRQDQIDGIEKENDALQKEIDDYDKLLNAVTLVVNEKRESIEAEQKAIDDRIEALQKENDEYQKQLELEQAKDALLKARQQRTKYIYSGENRGFIYDTDADAISEAEKNLSDLTFQATIDALEEEKELLNDILEQLDEVEKAWQDTADVWDNNKAKSTAEEILGSDYKDIILNADPEAIAAITQGYVNANQKLENNQSTIEAIETEIDELDKLGEKWNEIASEHEKAIDRENAAALLGAEWERLVLEGRQESFEDFKNNYLSIQEQIEDNTSLIESYEEKITYYEKLKAEWEAITDKIEEETQDRLIAEQFGADGEKAILEGRKDILEDFKTEYCRIQDELAVAAEESARRQLEAAKKAANIPVNVPIYSIVDDSGKVVKDDFTDLQEAGKTLEELNKSVRGANKRYHIETHIETHHSGLDSGYVGNGFRALSDDERLGILRRASINGLKQNEVPAVLERGELVLTEEQIKGISNSLVMPNYGGLLNGLTNIPKTVSPISNINQTFNITCPGITSQEVMNNLTRELQKLPLQMYQSSFKR